MNAINSFLTNNITAIIPILGYIASSLILVTFYMHGEIKIRTVAISSNIIGIIYSYLGYNNGMSAILPILILHSLLLPINLSRLKKLKAKTIATHEVNLSYMSIEDSEQLKLEKQWLVYGAWLTLVVLNSMFLVMYYEFTKV